MSVDKMLVVTLAATGGVLGAATRRSTGAPPAADLVGAGLLVRLKDSEASVTVLVSELAVKEVESNDEVFRNPLAHVVNDSDALIAVPTRIASITADSVEVMVTLPGTPAVPPDKAVVVVIDAGPNDDPLKFVGKTAAGVNDTKLPISGVPPGAHLVLASVAGYGSAIDIGTF